MGWKRCVLLQDNVPRAVTNHLPENYAVALTCLRSRRFNQIVYQLAHELTHVFVDPLIEHPFIEVIACLSSLAALEDFSQQWGRAGSAGLRAYAIKYAEYRDTIMEGPEKFLLQITPKHQNHLHRDQTIRSWAQNVEIDCYDRNAQLLLASYLLPQLAALKSWTAIRHVHHAIVPFSEGCTQSWKDNISTSAWRKACNEDIMCDDATASEFISFVEFLLNLPKAKVNASPGSAPS